MKAKIANKWVLDGKYLYCVTDACTTFYVPKGKCDRELIEAASCGDIDRMSSYTDEWCLTVETEKIEWED